MAKFEPVRESSPFEPARIFSGLRGMSLCGIGLEAGWVRYIPRDARGSAKTGLYLHHRMIIVRLCIHHPYQTGLFSLKRKDTKPIKSGYTLASYLSILVRLTFGVVSFIPAQDAGGDSSLLDPPQNRFSDTLRQKFKIKYDECNVYLFGISELIAEAINRALLRIEMAGRERRVGTSQLPSVAHVLMKIGVPRTCTAKACTSRGSGLGSSSRNRIPRRPVPRRPALTVYCGEARQGGSVQPNCHLYII
ncbi:hypothetical protein IGI04_026139 [Brassica rapa subsp. trilocularis]|uniref:Uncharacterized protein n=1 Tax=Brassica rapa subsp. trilocularis TaxID=1813537 RepID=A0ABQ7KWC9_BRACM|nr:hypothetical protein IGI04_026139 [Brassica rapa subsp. trilocularis]